MPNKKTQKGFAEIISLIAIALMLLTIPAAQKLVSQRQEPRKLAAEKCVAETGHPVGYEYNECISAGYSKRVKITESCGWQTIVQSQLDSACGQVPGGNQPPPPQQPSSGNQLCNSVGQACTEDYPEACTTTNGQSGTKLCHKIGTCFGIGKGDQCSFNTSKGSYCGDCTTSQPSLPAQPPVATGPKEGDYSQGPCGGNFGNSCTSETQCMCKFISGLWNVAEPAKQTGFAACCSNETTIAENPCFGKAKNELILKNNVCYRCGDDEKVLNTEGVSVCTTTQTQTQNPCFGKSNNDLVLENNVCYRCQNEKILKTEDLSICTPPVEIPAPIVTNPCFGKGNDELVEYNNNCYRCQNEKILKTEDLSVCESNSPSYVQCQAANCNQVNSSWPSKVFYQKCPNDGSACTAYTLGCSYPGIEITDINSYCNPEPKPILCELTNCNQVKSTWPSKTFYQKCDTAGSCTAYTTYPCISQTFISSIDNYCSPQEPQSPTNPCFGKSNDELTLNNNVCYRCSNEKIIKTEGLSACIPVQSQITTSPCFGKTNNELVLKNNVCYRCQNDKVLNTENVSICTPPPPVPVTTSNPCLGKGDNELTLNNNICYRCSNEKILKTEDVSLCKTSNTTTRYIQCKTTNCNQVNSNWPSKVFYQKCPSDGSSCTPYSLDCYSPYNEIKDLNTYCAPTATTNPCAGKKEWQAVISENTCYTCTNNKVLDKPNMNFCQAYEACKNHKELNIEKDGKCYTCEAYSYGEISLDFCRNDSVCQGKENGTNVMVADNCYRCLVGSIADRQLPEVCQNSSICVGKENFSKVSFKDKCYECLNGNILGDVENGLCNADNYCTGKSDQENVFVDGKCYKCNYNGHAWFEVDKTYCKNNICRNIPNNSHIKVGNKCFRCTAGYIWSENSIDQCQNDNVCQGKKQGSFVKQGEYCYECLGGKIFSANLESCTASTLNTGEKILQWLKVHFTFLHLK